jgi:hypothetical protein
MVLPDAEVLQQELENTRRLIESRVTALPRKRKRNRASRRAAVGLAGCARASCRIAAIRL